MDTHLIIEAINLTDDLSEELESRAKEHIGWKVIDVSTELAKTFKFKEALKMVEEFQFLAITEDLKHAFLGTIGKIYEELGEYEKAMNYYDEALRVGGSDWLIFRTHINICDLLIKIGKYKEAKEKFERFLKEKENLLRESGVDINSSPDMAMLYNEFGVILLRISKYDDAKFYLERAIRIWKSLIERGKGEFLSNLADSLHNLSLVFFEINDFCKALKLFMEAYKIYEKLINISPYDFLAYYAMVCNNIGLVFARIKKHKDAKEFLNKGLSAYLKLVLDVSDVYIPDVAMSFYNLGILHEGMGELEIAEKYYKKALKHYKRANAEFENAFLDDEAKVYLSLGRISIKQNNLLRALEFIRKALGILKIKEQRS